MEDFSNIKSMAGEYYSSKLRKYGETPKGVDWRDRLSQEIRFRELLAVVRNPKKSFSINDLGCGYGSLLEYLCDNEWACKKYIGYDLSKPMVEASRDRFNRRKCQGIDAHFFNHDQLTIADYTIASGIFNVKLKVQNLYWRNYILSTLNEMNENSLKGFAFNMLTNHSDSDYMVDHLYYAHPGYILEYCLKKFSKSVAVLHNYELYEFTVVVGKDNLRNTRAPREK